MEDPIKLASNTESAELDQGILVKYFKALTAELERDHPYLVESQENACRAYSLARDCLVEQMGESETNYETSVMIYGGVVAYLSHISSQQPPEDIPQIGRGAGRKKLIVENYLPATFDEFCAQCQQKEQKQKLTNAREAAAEAIIMDELETGLEAIVPEIREEIAAQILASLVYDEYERAEITRKLTALGLPKILEMLGMTSNKLEDLVDSNTGQVVEFNPESARKVEVALIILEARDYIQSALEPTEKPASAKLSVHALAEPGVFRLFAAMAQLKTAPKRSGKEIRLEKARPVLLTSRAK